MVASGAGDGRLSSLTARSLITNSEDSVLDKVGIRDDSSSEVDSMVGGREIESSLELTMDECATVTSRCSDSRSRLVLEMGLISEGGRGTDSGVTSSRSRWTSDSGDCREGTSVGVFGGGVGTLSTGRSMANERGVLSSEGIVLHNDAVS